MESESVSRLFMMSFTSATHKESGPQTVGGLHSGKDGVSKNPSSTLTSPTHGQKRVERQGGKAGETSQVVK